MNHNQFSFSVLFLASSPTGAHAHGRVAMEQMERSAIGGTIFFCLLAIAAIAIYFCFRRMQQEENEKIIAKLKSASKHFEQAEDYLKGRRGVSSNKNDEHEDEEDALAEDDNASSSQNDV